MLWATDKVRSIRETFRVGTRIALATSRPVSSGRILSMPFASAVSTGMIDLNQTSVVNGKLIKLFVWFDNEWAYANRMLDVAQYMSKNT